jgi:hypothetical protein
LLSERLVECVVVVTSQFNEGAREKRAKVSMIARCSHGDQMLQVRTQLGKFATNVVVRERAENSGGGQCGQLLHIICFQRNTQLRNWEIKRNTLST